VIRVEILAPGDVCEELVEEVSRPCTTWLRKFASVMPRATHDESSNGPQRGCLDLDGALDPNVELDVAVVVDSIVDLDLAVVLVFFDEDSRVSRSRSRVGSDVYVAVQRVNVSVQVDVKSDYVNG
jgi:hypothetical protein